MHIFHLRRWQVVYECKIRVSLAFNRSQTADVLNIVTVLCIENPKDLLAHLATWDCKSRKFCNMEEHGEMYEITIESNGVLNVTHYHAKRRTSFFEPEERNGVMERVLEKMSFWKTLNFQLLAENHWLGLF